MMKMIVACTREVDSVDKALTEIFRQLDLESRLMKNSVGIIACTPEFVESGVVAALCARLPFNTVGATTLRGAACGKYDTELFTLAVLTGDDIAFSTALSKPFSPSRAGIQIADLCQSAMAALPGKPSMALAYLPMEISSFNVSSIVKEMDEACGGIPIFGTVACDNSVKFSQNSGTLRNGGFYPNAISLLLMHGNVKPRFFLGNVEHFKEVRQQHGIITESEGNVLKKLNGLIFSEYFAHIGLPLRNLEIIPIPFMLTLNDGTQSIARVLHAVTPEGYGIFAGEMPEDSTIAIYQLDNRGVVATAENVTRALASLKDASGLLIHSCALRYMLLGLKWSDETRRVTQLLEDRAPYQFSYAGGEICPILNEAGNLTNRYHNFSFIACAF
jgi:hypothetical protein